MNSGYIFTMSFLIVLSIPGISHFVKFALYLVVGQFEMKVNAIE